MTLTAPRPSAWLEDLLRHRSPHQARHSRQKQNQNAPQQFSQGSPQGAKCWARLDQKAVEVLLRLPRLVVERAENHLMLTLGCKGANPRQPTLSEVLRGSVQACHQTKDPLPRG